VHRHQGVWFAAISSLMFPQIRSVFEELLTLITSEARRFMFRHVVEQQFLLFEDLVAFSAGVDFTVEVDEAVDSKFLLHFEASRAVRAFEVLCVGLLVWVNSSLVGVASCCGGEEASAI
jgi:hypothetical protein